MRIVSLLPSATEMLLALTGRVDHPRAELVGRSHECDFPAGASLARLPALTTARTNFQSSAQIDAEVRAALASGQSLYTLDTDRLKALKPDLILTQDLCQVCSIDLDTVRRVAAELSPTPRILSFNPWTIEGVFDDALRLGREIDMERESLALVSGGGGWRERMDRAAELAPAFAPRPVAVFLEWTDPLFIAGHWTPQLIERAGADHPLNATVPDESAGAAEGPAGLSQRKAGKSITIPASAIAAVQPEFVFIAPCGLSLEQALRETDLLAQRSRDQAPPASTAALRSADSQDWWSSLPAVRAAHARTGPGVYVIDGNHMFNRPGPRLVDAFEFLAAVINDRPDRLPADFPFTRWTVA